MVKHNIKIILDILMTIALICLMNTKITGMLCHKILGMIMLLLIIVHIILNLKDIKRFKVKLLDKTLKTSSKVAFMFNIILGVLLIVTIYTGKIISIPVNEGIKKIIIMHKVSAIFTFIGIAIHLGLHWHKILYGFRCLFKIKGKSKTRTIILRVILILLIILGLGHNQTSKIQMILKYVSKMALFTSISYYFCQLVRKKINKK